MTEAPARRGGNITSIVAPLPPPPPPPLPQPQQQQQQQVGSARQPTTQSSSSSPASERLNTPHHHLSSFNSPSSTLSSSLSIPAQPHNPFTLDDPVLPVEARKELLNSTLDPHPWTKSLVQEEDPETLQKKDPLATQIWRLYSKQKQSLPNAERMENLTWRMMAMALKREHNAR